MPSALLETKLFVPRRRSELVPRQRLIDRLNRGAQSKLTLVSAPAGFGKTTLLADWLKGVGSESRPVAWLSLDQTDNTQAAFWSYVIAALRTIAPGIGDASLGALQSASASIEAVLSPLLNEVSAIAGDFVLVLDDYHLVEEASIHEGVAFLLQHLPPQMHLVIATRSDPPLPIARLRGRNELVEIRAADLRFTTGEAAAFFTDSMGIELSAGDVDVLDARTEGWIAGLQLAALSMQGRADVAGFITAFTGDDRYIVDYLVEEVLERQPEDVRRFLLQTAILDRLSGPLCDAVTGARDGTGTLERLERSNLFVVPLDDRRQWYRYHHLFADVLQAHLLDDPSEDLQELHTRASTWYQQNREPAPAIRHAILGEDFERAATLIELAMPDLLRSRQEAMVRGWLDSLPDEMVRCRPVLCTSYAGVLLQMGEHDAVEGRIRDAERCLEDPAHGAVFVDEDAFRHLPGMIAVYHSGLAQVRGNAAESLKYARLALDLMPEEDDPGRGPASSLLGLALWTSGDLRVAHKTYAAGIARVRMSGYVPDSISGTITLAEMCIARGNLDEALAGYRRSLQYASEQAGPVPLGTGDLHVGMSEIFRERNDLEAAMQHLQTSRELGVGASLPENRFRWFVAMAGIQAAQGDLDGALSSLDEAERRYSRGFTPNVRPIPALRTNVWIAQGRLPEARRSVQEQGLSVDDDLSYAREFQHLTLARLLLAQAASEADSNAAADAARLLERLLSAAEAGERIGAVVQILTLLAIAHRAVGDVATGLDYLERALALAEPQGYVRVFVSEGDAMRDLLSRAVKEGRGGSYGSRLLAAFGELPSPLPAPVSATSTSLAEQLTAREIEILRLIGAGMRNQEIADHLVISPSTVKRHLANAYGKLAVNHRTEALLRAAELNLL